jgi:erythromycin esterase
MMMKTPWIFLLILSIIGCKTTKPITVLSDQHSEDSISFPYHPLESEKHLDILINEIADSRIILLGESTHGTHEFYEWRAAITKRLIKEKGFEVIAIEGDWTDTWRVNDLVNSPLRDSSTRIDILKQYDRWPQSMWGNFEFSDFIESLNAYNIAAERPVNIYGIDLYSFWEWTYNQLPYQDTILNSMISSVRNQFDSFNNDALKYAALVKSKNINYGKVTQALFDYINKKYPNETRLDQFLLKQYGLLTMMGERYFRTMNNGKVESWNIRENYMALTVKRLLAKHGRQSKAVIWVHNGHAGDATYSQMVEGGYLSLGQLLKKDFPNDIFSVAFGTNKGSVYAGYYWNAPLMEIKLPEAKKGSWENILHEVNPKNKLLLSREIINNPVFNKWLPFRSVGAAFSNNAVYGTAILPKRFDALIYIDSTRALKPVW